MTSRFDILVSRGIGFYVWPALYLISSEGKLDWGVKPFFAVEIYWLNRGIVFHYETR